MFRGDLSSAQPVTPKQNRCHPTNLDKLAFIDYAEKNKGMNLEEQGQYSRKNDFNPLNAATLSRYFKDKDKIWKEAGKSENLSTKKRCVVTYPEVEAVLIQWVKQAASLGHHGPAYLGQHPI
ncbi:hypothetical protein BT69DRAFT_1292368 [Atractiella rhizophila]|nr:hypothetical protein BT69DRAFT_1292368 [Atractiella rhizophila]